MVSSAGFPPLPSSTHCAFSLFSACQQQQTGFLQTQDVGEISAFASLETDPF